MLIQKNKQLTSFIGSIQASYVPLFSSLDILVRTHHIPSVGSLTKAKPKNQVQQEINEYLEQLIQNAIKEDLELDKQNMQKYVDGPVQVREMLLMLQNELKNGSKTLYLNSMEARVYFQLDIITQFGDTITQYQA